jgi:beta-lactamase regulating signal transducer with metallopeptidase domain
MFLGHEGLTMTNWLPSLAVWLADFYLAATVLLAVAAACFIRVRQPARRVAVAWGTLLALLLAVALCLSSSRPHIDLRGIFARPEATTARLEPAETAVLQPHATPIAHQPLQPAVLLPGVLEQSVEVRGEAETIGQALQHPRIEARTILAGALFVFLAGSLLMTLRLAAGVWRASRLVRESLPVDRALCDELRGIAAAEARLPRLRSNPHLATSVATGTIRPTILLPQRFVQNSTRIQRRAVLAHEWAHIRNGDLWLLALDRCLLPLLWAHPAYWWVRRRIRQDQEYLADAAAASLTGPVDYAAQLLVWARELVGVRPVVASSAVGIWERPSGLALRIAAILNQGDRMAPGFSGRTRMAVIAGLAAGSLLAAALSVRPRSVESAPPARGATAVVIDPSENGDIKLGSDDLGGSCRLTQDKPLPGVQVELYHVVVPYFGEGRLVRRTSTNAAGEFVFRHIPRLNRRENNEEYEVVARSPGYTTCTKQVVDRTQYWVEFGMGKAVTLKGVVKDRQGRAVAGALLYLFYDRLRVPGIQCARTNALGQFAIDDLGKYQYIEPKDVPHAVRSTSQRPIDLVVEHPEYVMTRIPCERFPDEKAIALEKGSVLTGRVVRADTGQPAVGLAVAVERLMPEGEDAWEERFWTYARTDHNGRYRLKLPAGQFDLRVHTDLHTAVQLHAWEVRAGQTVEAPVIRLTKGAKPAAARPASSSLSPDEARKVADADLAKTYALREGQNIRHFDEPYPEARKWWVPLNFGPIPIKRADGGIEQATPFVAVTVRLRDGELLGQETYAIISLQNPVRRALADVIDTVCGIPPQDILGPEELVQSPITGDFAVRAGLPAERLLPELERILRSECHLRVQLKLETENRNVLVAEGRFAPKPLQGQHGEIALYGETPPGAPDSDGAGGGTGSFDKFLVHLGRWINRPIMNEVQAPPRDVSWHNIARGLHTELERAEDHDPQLVIKHVAEQTGLIFHGETRPVRVLHVE